MSDEGTVPAKLLDPACKFPDDCGFPRCGCPDAEQGRQGEAQPRGEPVAQSSATSSEGCTVSPLRDGGNRQEVTTLPPVVPAEPPDIEAMAAQMADFALGFLSKLSPEEREARIRAFQEAAASAPAADMEARIREALVAIVGHDEDCDRLYDETDPCDCTNRLTTPEEVRGLNVLRDLLRESEAKIAALRSSVVSESGKAWEAAERRWEESEAKYVARIEEAERKLVESEALAKFEDHRDSHIAILQEGYTAIEQALGGDPGDSIIDRVDDLKRRLAEAEARRQGAEELRDAELDAMLDDLAALLCALGLGDHARPLTPRTVMREAITHAASLRDRLAAAEKGQGCDECRVRIKNLRDCLAATEKQLATVEARRQEAEEKATGMAALLFSSKPLVVLRDRLAAAEKERDEAKRSSADACAYYEQFLADLRARLLSDAQVIESLTAGLKDASSRARFLGWREGCEVWEAALLAAKAWKEQEK